MTPTTRNSLMVGGAAIVIALLLTCGPLQGIFGGNEAEVAEAPAVAAGPPVDASDSIETAAVETAAMGAVAGGSLGDANVAGSVSGGDAGTSAEAAVVDPAAKAVSTPVVAGAAGAAGAAGGAAVAATTVAGSSAATTTTAGAGAAGATAATTAATTRATPPPVSSGPPVIATPVMASTPVASAAVVNPLAAAAAAGASAVKSFDEAYAETAQGQQGLPAAGPVVGRFAPPVAAIAGSTLALNGVNRGVGLDAGSIRQPCDSPGAGCLRGTPAPANPPIVPGTRP